MTEIPPKTNTTYPMSKSVAVIGGGPAGLMAAETLAQAGMRVAVYEAMPSPGRKFLRAGVGGLNLTHSELREQFLARYGSRRPQLQPILNAFGPDDVRAWAQGLGFESFVGSSGRVFPVGMKASPLLRAWLKRLDEAGVVFHTGYRFIHVIASERSPASEAISRLMGKTDLPEIATGQSAPLATTLCSLRFDSPEGQKTVHADAVILALGGGSWSRLGSDAAWVPLLAKHGVTITPLKPANCGFDVAWSEHFKTKFDGAPLKTVVASFKDLRQQGQFIVTKEGLEGSLVYALSAPLRDEIEATGSAVLTLDLAPAWTQARLAEALARPRGTRSMASHLEKTVGLKGVKAGLLWEFVARDDFSDPQKLSAAIKALPVLLLAPRPIDEAISTAGGVAFESLDERLMLKALPGVFCAGEMLDWEAPTGGYLLTACMSTGRWAARGVMEYYSSLVE
jgi:uncharacterized flavoprotein (TIGR03862 family)